MTTCEASFRQYITVFDGTKREFSEVEQTKFDNLFHKDFTMTIKTTEAYESIKEDCYYGKMITRDELIAIHENLLWRRKGIIDLWTKATLIHFRKIGLDCLDVQFRVQNEDEDKVTRVVYTIEDGKIIWAQVVDDKFVPVMKAKCACGFRTFQSMNRYPTDMGVKP
eukprot:205299_1